MKNNTFGSTNTILIEPKITNKIFLKLVNKKLIRHLKKYSEYWFRDQNGKYSFFGAGETEKLIIACNYCGSKTYGHSSICLYNKTYL